MNKSEAEHLVINTFTHAFSEERFTQFIRNLLPDLQPASTRTIPNAQLPQGFRDTVHGYTRLGTYRDPQGDVLDVVVVKLKQQGSLDRARTRQRNLMAHYLNKRTKDAVLVAYITDDLEDWRFSFVKLAYQTEITDKGAVKVEKEFTPARRYSFLVGEHEPNHTAQKQLSDLLMSEGQLTIMQIEEAFSIESVTKEFFEDYKSLFLHIKENLDQIVFSNQTVKYEFDRCEIDTTNFAKKLLGQIVFLYFLQKKGWLGVSKDDIWGTGDKKFLSNLFERNKDHNFFDDILEPFFYEALAIERIGDYYPALECKVPFLNGGLFEPLYGYDWKNIRIGLDNQVFEDVFQIFNRYNFTVREDEPLEKEVAVDPEMLGKVFENLLEVKDRKSKGAFYTPREIVHFMCQESLINYLDTALNCEEKKVDKGDIEIFIREGDLSIERDQAREEGKLNDDDYSLPECIRKHSKEIDFALADVKICDPAIGSGAFPVGMMTEIVRARNVLTPYLQNHLGRDAYTFKWRCIESCLYGVDIDASAVEIAKLRLWLSLIVDEENYEKIRPLPNLDYKIICGNSLLSIQKNLFNYNLYPELEKKKVQYFGATSHRNKVVLKKEIEELINQLTNEKKWFDLEIYFSEVFSPKQGFDIVIGNPPYGLLNKKQNQKMGHITTKEELSFYKNSRHYLPAKGGMINVFRLFICQGLRYLKKDGSLCFIIPIAFLGDLSAGRLRQYILENKRFKFIEAFPERDDKSKRVFEAVKMSVCIIGINNENDSSNNSFFLRVHRDKFVDLHNPKTEISHQVVSRIDPINFSIPLVNPKELRLLVKLNSKSKKLSNIGKCFTGEIDLTHNKKMLTNNPKDAKLIKGAQVQKYHLLQEMSQGEIMYLQSHKYLINTKSERSAHHMKRRIVMQGITGINEKERLKLTIINPPTFCANSVNYIIIHDKDYELEYLLGILNSKLLNWYFKSLSTNSNVNGYEVDALPIVDVSMDNKKNIVNKVKQILQTSTSEDNSSLESEIDQIVYRLYGVTEEEAEIIEMSGGS